MLGKDWEIAVRVVHAGVVVVGHRDDKEEVDLGATGGETETVGEGIVGFRVGTQEEASLGTTAGDHVIATGQDLAWEGHAGLSVAGAE